MHGIADANNQGMEPNTPDRERLDELDRCFECGAIVAPEDLHGSKVAEGIVLCPECCRRASPVDDEAPTLRLPKGWYEDLAGESHHT